MKVLFFGGGLGNQIFEYAFFLYMKSQIGGEKIYGVYDRNKLSAHNGLEIQKWFKVTLPEESLMGYTLYYIAYILKKTLKIGSLIDLNTRKIMNEKAVVFNAYKYSKHYLPHQDEWLSWCDVLSRFTEQNVKYLKQIEDVTSVFIHIRRGDYLKPQYKDMFEGCCSLDYYNDAMELARNHFSKPTFFVFSDDIEWAKQNLIFQEPAVFVEGNEGVNSPIDMFLMSKCKGAIMANSTFSYWASYLGKIEFVTYPLKWIKSPMGVPDIFFDNWIGI